ncbi:hypothetical protein [Kineococcus auxinigenes]|uniref:hypothetical protein n=1 Tax=unclassified Kineococcus TaxID=2621656 RepID=UPI003D7E282B
MAVLGFTGRRSGRRFEVPVGVHDVAGRRLVFTGAPWRVNFRGGAPAELLSGGRIGTVHVDLVEDPAEVGALFRATFAAGTTAAQLALRIAPGHDPGDEELAAQRNVLLLRQAVRCCRHRDLAAGESRCRRAPWLPGTSHCPPWRGNPGGGRRGRWSSPSGRGCSTRPSPC